MKTPGPARRRSRRLDLFVLIAVSLLCGVAAELVLRSDYFLYESPARVYVPTHQMQETGFFRLTGDPELPYRMLPGASKRFWWGAEIETNERGWLGDARSSPAGPDLLIAGDSVAFGLGVAREESFPERLRRALPGARIAVLAAPGYNTSHEVAWIERVIEAGEFAPDLVILQFGLNDYQQLDRIVERGRYQFYERVPTRIPFPAPGLYATLLERSQLLFRANHAVMRRLEGWLPLYDLPDRSARLAAAIERLERLGRAHGFEIVLLQLPYREKTLDEARFERAAERSLSRLGHRLDLTRELAGRRRFWFDRLHPGAEGHERIALRLRLYLSTLGMEGL